MTADVYKDAFEKLLAAHCPTSRVREIEAGGSPAALWLELCESGFADALVAQNAGGAGLRLEEIFPMLLAAGAHALPVPLTFTMVARAVLADEGIESPTGSITFALADAASSAEFTCRAVPWGMTAEWALVASASGIFLLPTATAARERYGTPGSLAADLRWADVTSARTLQQPIDLRSVCAAVISGHMAGAMEKLLTQSVEHANLRKQFGKSIGKFQAIQQQLSVMAEHVFAARAAAESGSRGGWQSRDYLPAPLQAAAAKSRCSDAVVSVATTAHAVHGAVSITHEFDLQLLTRRLHEWRQTSGGEGYWQHQLGDAWLSSGASLLDFVRLRLGAGPAP